MLETFLAGKEYITDSGNSKNVLSGFMTNYKEAIIDSLNYLFGLDGYILKPEDVIDKNLEDVLSKFGHNLLMGSIPIEKAVIKDAQLQNTIKQDLFKENKLTNTCDEA